jgi:hypothetical protein
VAKKKSVKELCKEHALPIEFAWALCALKKGGSVASHRRKGKCRCTDPSKMCQRCCPNCDDRAFKGKELCLHLNADQPAIVTPTAERITKVRAEARIKEVIARERFDFHEDNDAADDSPSEQLYPSPKCLLDVAKFLGMTTQDINEIPSPKYVSSLSDAQAFFAAESRGTKIALSCRWQRPAKRSYVVVLDCRHHSWLQGTRRWLLKLCFKDPHMQLEL